MITFPFPLLTPASPPLSLPCFYSSLPFSPTPAYPSLPTYQRWGGASSQANVVWLPLLPVSSSSTIAYDTVALFIALAPEYEYQALFYRMHSLIEFSHLPLSHLFPTFTYTSSHNPTSGSGMHTPALHFGVLQTTLELEGDSKHGGRGGMVSGGTPQSNSANSKYTSWMQSVAKLVCLYWHRIIRLPNASWIKKLPSLHICSQSFSSDLNYTDLELPWATATV